MVRSRGVAFSAGLALLLVALVSGCTREPAPEQSPPEAAKYITERMFLTAETTACLEKVFTDQPELASALNVDEDKQASPKRLEEFLAGVRPCLTAAVVADAYVRIAPSGVVVDDTQKTCIRDTILKMDDTGRDELIELGAGTPTADASMGKAVSQLTQACNLQTPTGLPEGSVPTVGPGGGATVVTR